MTTKTVFAIGCKSKDGQEMFYSDPILTTPFQGPIVLRTLAMMFRQAQKELRLSSKQFIDYPMNVARVFRVVCDRSDGNVTIDTLSDVVKSEHSAIWYPQSLSLRHYRYNLVEPVYSERYYAARWQETWRDSGADLSAWGK